MEEEGEVEEGRGRLDLLILYVLAMPPHFACGWVMTFLCITFLKVHHACDWQRVFRSVTPLLCLSTQVTSYLPPEYVPEHYSQISNMYIQ